MAYIINKYGVFTDIPDDFDLPAGARRASPKEIADWKAADAAAKPALRAKKMAAAQRKLLGLAGPDDEDEPSTPPDPAKDKGKGDGK